MDQTLNALLREYAARREEAQQQAQARKEALSLRSPALADLFRQRRTLLLSVPRERFDPDPAAAAERRRAALADLEAEQTRLLAELGLPADYLQPRYRCPRCEDTGYVGQNPRRMCACLLTRRADAALGSAGLPAAERFETFRRDIYADPAQLQRMEKVYALTLAYAEAFPHPEKPDLLLLGSPGLGKTFFLNAVGARVLQRGFAVKKTTAYAMVQEIMAGFAADKDAAAAYQSAPLLLLDDLGSEPMIPNVTVEYLFSILNERRIRGLSTVTATNLSPTQLGERYGERILSRLLQTDQTILLHLTGRNLRIRQG